MSQPDLDARLRAADRTIALIGATGYMRSEFPAARMEWGNQDAPPEPDDIDEIWCEPAGDEGDPGRWFAVTAVSGSYGPAERSYSWGQRVLAGTRDYLRFAVKRLREHGQGRLADALETEMLASRLVYLELTTVGDSTETARVRARQYDISDATLVAAMLDAVRGHDSNRIESLRQPLGRGAAGLLADAYWTLPGWYEKALLVRFAYGARDRSHPGLRAVFADLLGIPDTAPGIGAHDDTSREARTFALTWLDGDVDPDSFVRLYEDEDAQAAGIARYRGPGR
jgi:hypothetical protein